MMGNDNVAENNIRGERGRVIHNIISRLESQVYHASQFQITRKMI